ncbi:MAG: hypothetical protein ISS15_00440 [Alphaproteobacteria bacterium]|nr:hypothetical protein [Alphaproteobacteria bacterium]MBL6937340.1 hypothetical protein [Alphaproteobacteria bacterium]MBL7096098.1 hypothetical protein [Alphaproteobacteria bacterium]
MSSSLVPGRSCGDCNVCCSYYHINDPMLRKPKDTLCPLWNGGCSIYAVRPRACSEFYCLWRRTPSLDDGWRPNRIGIIIHETDIAIPEHFVERVGLIFDVCGSTEVLRDARVVIAIAEQIDRGIPVFLGIIGDPQHDAARVLLNDRMKSAVAGRDLAALRRDLEAALAEARTQSRSRPLGVDS